MTRRLALAWSAGASVGLLVGFLVGESVRDLAAFRALRRAEPGPGAPQPPFGHSETPEDGNRAQTGAQRRTVPAARCGVLDPVGRNRCDRVTGHPGLHRSDAHTVPWPDPEPIPPECFDEDGVLLGRIAHPIPAQRDDEPCTHTLGTLTCPFRGPHDNHTYQGIYAPDAKSDADEEVE